MVCHGLTDAVLASCEPAGLELDGGGGWAKTGGVWVQQGWPLATLQKYLFHVRQTLEPRMRPEAERLLLAYYQWQRRAAERSSARTTIRMLESLLRLAQVPPVFHLALSQTSYLLVQRNLTEIVANTSFSGWKLSTGAASLA